MKPPVHYRVGPETLEDDEAETQRGIAAASRDMLETSAEGGGPAIRSVHAKGHAYVQATLEVPPGLPPEFAQGLLDSPGTHGAILRVSLNPDDIQDDKLSVPRGANLKLLARTTDRAKWAKQAMSAMLRAAERALENGRTESVAHKAVGGAPYVHPLGEIHHGHTAYRHGDYVAKHSLAPVSPSLRAHADDKIAAGGRPDAIDRDMTEAPMEWELRVQLVRDEAVQPPWTPTRATLDDRLRFSPWTGPATDRPLGVINPVRHDTHDLSAAVRARVNRCPVREPATADLP